MDADVVTLGLMYDTDAFAKQAEPVPSDWQKHLLNNSSPYTTPVVFRVRKGNPKQLKDWAIFDQIYLKK